jgi:sulfite reductase alpha subunit-like flavoprotein
LHETGEGEAPDNAKECFTKLRQEAAPAGSMVGVAFTILCLGDSSYETYMTVSRTIQKRYRGSSSVIIFKGVVFV